MNHPLLVILVKVTIFSLMLAIGINLSFEKLLSLWRQPKLLFRDLFAVTVLVPLVVIILLKLFNQPKEVEMGLALLAVSPGAPLMSKRSQMAGVSVFHSAGLQLTLALVAVFVTPLTLNIFHAIFDLQTEKLSILEVSGQIFMAQLLPVSIGLLIQRFLPKVALKIGKPLTMFYNSLFLLLALLLLIPALRTTLNIGIITTLLIILMVLISMGIGHFLGGPDLEKRSALAIACIARNIGLALFIAVLNNAEKQVFPILASYAVLGSMFAIPYSQWSKKKMGQII